MSTNDPNIIIELLTAYFTEEKFATIGLVILSLLVNGIQAHGIAKISAEMVQSVETNNRTLTTKFYVYLCMAFLLFLLLNYAYKYCQNRILTKMRQWLRHKLLHTLLYSNKENMEETNYPRISSPINRIASVCFLLFNNLFSLIMPNISFLVVVAVFLFVTQPYLGLVFTIGNLLIAFVVYWNWPSMFEKNRSSVEIEYDNEALLLEVLHNFEKIIYRGQMDKESKLFEEKTAEAIEKAVEFQSELEVYSAYINTISSSTVAIIMWRIIDLTYSKTLSVTYFITALTMMVLYRDKMSDVAQIIPDCVEFIGRTSTALKHFKNLSITTKPTEFGDQKLAFNEIRFENVSFRYKTAKTDVISGLSLTLKTTGDEIIGITGLSGKGKSTIMKILLKLHSVREGSVYIDGKNIDDISPDYIRANVTYVSQNGKLFDRKVIENIMYGCSHPDTCDAELKRVLKYPKIRGLFQNMDIENKQSGNLGENLSGGQRQVVNIIGGLINPSKILVLDEPTNALDPSLKWEIIRLIQDYSTKKNAIIIITHDKDLDQIFTNKVIL